MKGFNIFLLGRPGCGKSEIFRRLAEKFKSENIYDDFVRVDDFPKLWAIFQDDEKTGRWAHCRKTPDGGYKVTDGGIWNDILKQVNGDVLSLQKDGRVVFIEFSRPNYIESLKNFSDEILKNSVMVYVSCSFETCWSRNVARHESAVAKGTDDHLVSREEMEKTYLHDDSDALFELLKAGQFSKSGGTALLQALKIPVLDVNTDSPGTDHLVPKIERIFGEIKKVFEGRK